MSWSSYKNSSNSSYDAYAASLNGKWQWKDSYRWVDFEEVTGREIDNQIIEHWQK